MDAAEDLAEHVGLASACKAMRVSRASVYRRRKPSQSRHGNTQKHPRALSPAEQHRVLVTLTSERFVNCAPAAVHAMLLENQEYLCSVRTMYRVLAKALLMAPRKRG